MNKLKEIEYEYLKSIRCFLDNVECAICQRPISYETVTVARYRSSRRIFNFNLVICTSCTVPSKFTRFE